MRPLVSIAILLIGLGLLAAMACGSSDPSTPTPTPAQTPTPLVFLPQDDASHPVNTEWWYYNGHITTEDGALYGFHLVFFQILVPGADSFVHIGHFAVTDHQRGTYTTAQQIAARPLEPPEQGFLVSTGTWKASGSGGTDTLMASSDAYELHLDLSPGKPVVLHDGDGLVEFPIGGDSFYYSRTRMPGTGTLVDHGREIQITAQVWMDHQWGDFSRTAIGWDWFSLQLDDETELMLTIVRDLEGDVIRKFGTMVSAEGNTLHLGTQEFQVEAIGTWDSPSTGATYPSGWRVSVPDKSLSLTLVPVLRDAEFDSRSTTLNYYWEGQVTAEGQRDEKPVTAVGFVELTGY